MRATATSRRAGRESRARTTSRPSIEAKRRDDTATPFEGDDGRGIVERRPGIVFARVIPFMTAASGTDARDDVEDDIGYDDPDVRYDDHVAREALRAFVRTALEETRRGGSHRAQYYELLEACAESARATDGDADGATALMDALCSYATLIDERTHHQLVERAFLRVDPWTCARRVRETALRFGTQLVCAQGGTFSGAVVGKLVESMIAPVEYDEWWREDADEADEEAMERARVGRRVVEDVTSCAGNILRLVPQSERTMIAALRTGIPHKSSPKAMQVGYMRAAFALVESERGAPLRDEFLKAVVAHALDVDVEIKWDDVMADAERTSADRGAKKEEEEDDAIFELDDIEKTIEEQCRAEWEQRPATSAPLAVDEAADTLDALMELALTHIDKRIDDGDVVLVRRALMHAFTLTLLPAPRSKFVQFLVFHLCSRDEETCRELTELLFTKLVDVSEAGSIRLAAAAYFASFLARAKHLTPEFVCDLLKRLVDWCLSHVKQRTTPGSVALSGAMEKTKVGMPPPPPHQALAVFDSACQAMMYVICYRAEDISRAGGTTAMKLQSLPLCEVLYSHLRPLATCLPSVVTEFLHRAVGANMNGFTSVLLKEHMERMATGQGTDVSSNMPLSRNPSMDFTSTQIASTSRSRFPLRMFFPFDPYVLRRSADLLKLHDTYVFWTGSEVDRAVDSESDMEDEDAEEDDMQLSSESEDNELETVSRSSLSDQARSFGVGSLNTRPRKKIFRGLRQPKPLFGRARADGSPHSPGGASGPSPSPASANGFAAMAARWRQTDDPSSLSPLQDELPQAVRGTPPLVVTSFFTEPGNENS